jgi:hypothetical protein
MNLEATYGQKLRNGIIRLITDLKGKLPLPMYKVRQQYLDKAGIDVSALTASQKKRIRERFSAALDNLEGSWVTSEYVTDARHVPNRMIHYHEPTSTR